MKAKRKHAARPKVLPQRSRALDLTAGGQRILELIARGVPLEKSMDALLRFLERDTPGMRCSILLLDPDGRRMRDCAAPSLPKAYRKAIDGEAIGPKAGSCGTAAYRKKPVIVVDIRIDPLWEPYRAAAAQFGFRACWSTPIFGTRRRVLGTFAMYFRRPGRPTARHRELIGMATHVAAIAIGKHRDEADLRQGEQRLRLALSGGNVGIWEWNNRDHRIFWNDSMKALFGLPAGAVIPGFDHIFDLVHPADRRRVQAAFRSAAQSGTEYEVEHRVVLPDGGLRTLASRGRRDVDPATGVVRLFGVSFDISERKSGEHERERLMRELGERVKELTVMHYAGLLLQTDRPLGQALLNELVLLFPSGWKYPEICQARIVYGKWEARTSGWRESPWRITESIRTFDGTTGMIEVNYTEERPAAVEGPFLAEERRLLRSLAGILVAYLNRICAESRLLESEERYRLVNLATDDAVWDWDLSNNSLWWNDGITSLFGHRKEDVRGDILWWVEQLHPDDRDPVHDSIQAVADGDGHSWTAEYRFRRADGNYADVHDRGHVMRDPVGKAVRMIGAMQDITGRKQAELRIRRLNRTYQVLSGINSAIVHVHDRQKLFSEACRIAVEHGQFGIAWIGEVDRATMRIIPRAWGGNVTAELLDRIGHSVATAAREGMGTTGRAIRENAAIYCNDIAAELDVGVGRTEMLELGYRSLISLPLAVGGIVVGAMVLYTLERDFFDEEEMKLLRELAADISFALEYIEKEEKVLDLAYHEPITHLPNRAALQGRLARAIEDAAAGGQALALLLMNLNHFRDINDSLGHQNGDLLLKHVADTLLKTLWGSDQVASLGGDEFAILLPRLADKSHIDLVLAKIETSLNDPVVLAGVPVNVEATLGIALFPDHGTTADLLWQHTDVALRTAKERHEPHLFYSAAIDHYDPKRLALVGELRDAIDAGQLLLHFQPKIDLRSGRAVAVEALVRWKHPSRGLIPPDQFIPLAEQTGLINPLTNWVVTAALRCGRELDRQELPVQISINLSARNLHHADFRRKTLELVRTSGFPTDRLIMEITESAIMADPQRAKAVLDELSRAGIRLSMDDFGIGQSSLSYLKDLPISRMKIDKSFVMEFAQPRNAAIVRAAIELAHNLGLAVTAEGVEDEPTMQELRKLGCDLAQGYFFCKPVPMEMLMDWLRQSRWKYAAD